MRKCLAGVLIVAAGAFTGCSSGSPTTDQATPQRSWTILFYGAGDTDERSLLKALAGIKASLAADGGLEFIVLIGRGGRYLGGKEIFGEEFQGARLYRFAAGHAERLDGGKAFPEISRTAEADPDLGDAETLRKFIRFGKASSPARHYALIFFGHGCGAYFCPDTRHGDALQPAKVSAILTDQESVDLVVFDVCSMGGIEVAYQWRAGNGGFQSAVMVASPSLGDSLPYERILRRLRGPGGTADGIDPGKMTALDFGRHIIEETRAQRREVRNRPSDAFDAWACYDLTRAATVKQAVDALAAELAKTQGAREIMGTIRGAGKRPLVLHYMDRQNIEKCWPHTPYFDLYDLAQRVRDCAALPAGVREKAVGVMKAVSELIVASFGEKVYSSFAAGRNGVSIVFPDGDALCEGKRHWEICSRWYRPQAAVGGSSQVYGRLAWCRDGAIPGNGVVENWFELLDSWYDTSNDEQGGINGYRW